MTDEEKLRTIATEMRNMTADRMATLDKMIEAAELLKASGEIKSDDLKVEELVELIRRQRAELAGIAEQLEHTLAGVLPANMKTLPVGTEKN